MRRSSRVLICLVVIAGLATSSCEDRRPRVHADAQAKTPPASAAHESEPKPSAVPAADPASYGAFLQEGFELDATASAQQRARIARALTRAVRRCLASRWTEWVCPGNLELEIVVHPRQTAELALRTVDERGPPEDASLRPCLEQMLQPLRELGFERRAQIVFPIAVIEAYRNKLASGCGDDPELGVPEVGPLPSATGESPVLSAKPREYAVSKEQIRRHIRQAVGHCMQEDRDRWQNSGVTVVELWFDPAGSHARSNQRTDRPVVLLSWDQFGSVEVRGPVLECMTRQAQPLIALAKQHRQPLRVTYPIRYGH